MKHTIDREQKKLIKWYIAIWLKEGEYLDFWSVNHVLLGGVLLGTFLFAHFTLNLALVFSILFMISWEFYEIVKGIREQPGNKIFDVLTGIIGFFLFHYLLNIYPLVNIYLIFMFLFDALEAWGWYASHKNGVHFI
jgi:hypothetical protein